MLAAALFTNMQYPVSTLSGSYPLLEQRWIRWHGVTPSLDITFPVHLCAGGCNHECTFARAGAMSNHDALAREHLFNILAHGRTPAPTQGRLLALPRPPAFSYTPTSHARATGAATCDRREALRRPTDAAPASAAGHLDSEAALWCRP